jgi:ribose transport system substrate-binding protein
VQKPFQFGYLSAKFLHDLAYNGEAALPTDPNVDTGVQVIKADNVADFRKKLEDMKK